MHFRTRAIHVGQKCDPATGAVVPPVHVASTFVQHVAGMWREFDYSRSGNPTRKAFETTLASLEGGCGALAFASGMAATHCAVMLLSAGDHVMAGHDIYGGTYRLLHQITNRHGIGVTLVDATDPAKINAAMTPDTKLVWIESPGNPQMSITDIAACAEIAHQHGALLGVDSTFATPVLTRPLELGADIVMHSATKYLGGHSDLVGGALVVRDPDLFDRLYFIQNATGAVMSPFDSFLAVRGLKTLELRVREQSRTAKQLAEWLAQRESNSPRALPRPADAPRPRDRQAPNGRRIRRDAVVRAVRRLRSDETLCRVDETFPARRQPRRGRVAHRTTGLHVARQLRRCRPRQARHHRWPDTTIRRPGSLGGSA